MRIVKKMPFLQYILYILKALANIQLYFDHT